jgi:AraC family transcriptional regulator, transcriptional activator of pobA
MTHANNIATHSLDYGKDILISNIGDNNNQSQLHRHDYWEILLFEEGRGKHLIDFETKAIKKHSIHFILPNEVHKLDCSNDTIGRVLMIADDFFHSRIENNQFIIELANYHLQKNTPIIESSSIDFMELWNITDKILEEIDRPKKMNGIVLRNYLSIFLCKCIEKSFDFRATFYPCEDLVLFLKFKLFVEKHFIKYSKIKDYLKLLAITDKKLNMICFKYMSISPSEFLHQRILAESKRLLLLGMACQKQIADTLNFTDVSHFIKFFKQRTGFLPKEFALKHHYH